MAAWCGARVRERLVYAPEDRFVGQIQQPVVLRSQIKDFWINQRLVHEDKVALRNELEQGPVDVVEGRCCSETSYNAGEVIE